MDLDMKLDSRDYAIILAVVLVGLATGTTAGVLADSSSLLEIVTGDRGGEDSSLGIEHPNITVASRGDWNAGKVQGETTRVSGEALVIRDGHLSVDYWESRTFQVDSIEELRIFADIPEPEASTVTAKVIVSDNPDFGDASGNYVRTGEQTFSLRDGWNVFEVDAFNERYHRIWLSLKRENTSVASPSVENYTVSVERASSHPLFPAS